MARSHTILLIGVAIAPTALARPDFIPLPYTSTSRFIPDGISGDGNVVVGADYTAGYPARWSIGAGVQQLTPLTSGLAMDASYNGSVVVGSSGFRWTASSSTIIPPPPGYMTVHAVAVSADGTTVAAEALKYTASLFWASFRWTEVGGMQPISPSPGFSGPTGWSVLDISADGDVVLGRYHSYDIMAGGVVYGDGWRWTPATGIVPLAVPTAYSRATPWAISKDGLNVVGNAGYFTGGPYQLTLHFYPYRWAPDPQPIEPLGTSNSTATDVSADGSIVVGMNVIDANYSVGWIWSSAAGTRDLKQVLLDLGVVSVTGWTLAQPWAISDDGTVIAGRGFNPAGQDAGWVAYLDDDCYPDCNADGALTVADFGCFQAKFFMAAPYADCNQDGSLTVADFGCFQTEFVAGCP